MAYSEKARQYAAQTLQQRRMETSIETDRRRAEAFLKVPDLAELEQSISAIGLTYVKTMLAGGDDAADSGPSIREQIAALQQQQVSLLVANGLPGDALDTLHHCLHCNDSGIADSGDTCRCVQQLLRQYSMDEVNRSSPLELCDFDNFSLAYYSAEFDKDLGDSPRNVMQENLEECRRFAKAFPQPDVNLLMTGDAGLGKTHLALSIAREVLQRGYAVIYCSAANIFRQIEAEQFNNNRDTTTLDSLKRCDLLILDDLGAEHTGFFLNSVLYDIINTRILQNRPTVYTTNITTDRILTSRYGEKISSRLIGCSKTLPFFGDDIRIQKNNL
jgi:DNA replication protein DnaC